MHMCDDDAVCGSKCLFSNAVLMAGDVILVNQLVMVALLYPMPHSQAELKTVAYVLFLVVNTVLYVVVPTDDDWQMACFGGAALLAVGLWHYYVRQMATVDGNVRHFIKKHVDVTSGVLFVLFAVGGLAMRFVGNAEYGLYTPLHSAWHVAGFAAEYFYFRIFDTEGAWTWRTMDVCQGAYDVAAMDEEQVCEDVSLAVLAGSV
jgi:hypothetical protein